MRPHIFYASECKVVQEFMGTKEKKELGINWTKNHFLCTFCTRCKELNIFHKIEQKTFSKYISMRTKKNAKYFADSKSTHKIEKRRTKKVLFIYENCPYKFFFK